MVPGFNTDFKYRGETYHVQTEDNGVANPVVVSLLYFKGAILASRRTSYRDLAAKPGFEQELMAMMKTQHKDLMRSLLAGELDRKSTAPTADASGEVPPTPALAAAPGPLPEHQPEPAPAPALSTAPAPAPVLPAIEAQRKKMTLDEAIRNYLQQYSAETAAAH